MVFFIALGCLAVRIAGAVETPGQGWKVALALFSGYVAADFLSGFVHWAGDTLGDENTPFLGKNFVLPFRYHHADPKAMTHHDFIETNGNNCIISVPALLAMVGWMPREAAGPWFFGSVVLAATTWFVFCTNQFHKWAHADHRPVLVRALQRSGLALSPEHHAIHHAAPHDKYYCITTGWLNPLLTRVRFFRACEAIVARLYPSFLHLEERARMPPMASEREGLT